MSTLTIESAFRPVFTPAVRRNSVRLTRRGRVVVLLASLVLAFAVGIMVAAGSVATGQAGQPEPTKVITVGTGDTLWAISSDLTDDGDVRATMERIKSLNAMEDGMLAAGQKLVVPAP
jgi:hypothetical protein